MVSSMYQSGADWFSVLKAFLQSRLVWREFLHRVMSLENHSPLEIHSHPLSSPALHARLRAHLPYSLPLLRRLQWSNFDSTSSTATGTATVLATFRPSSAAPPTSLHANGSHGPDAGARHCWAAICADRSLAPETSAWMSACLEDPAHSPSAQCTIYIRALLCRLYGIYASNNGENKSDADVLLIGALHERVLDVLLQADQSSPLSLLPSPSSTSTKKQQIGKANGAQKRIVQRRHGPYRKYIFKVEDMVGQRKEIALPKDLGFSRVAEADFDLVLSRTTIPRQKRTLARLMSVAVVPSMGSSVASTEKSDGHGRLVLERGNDKRPVAWGFLGADGSLISLHCEEAWRGRGLAKAVTRKLFSEQRVDDGLAHADVAEDNLASRALCESLRGEYGWGDYWTWVDLSAAGGVNKA